ncbi:amyloid-beta A4 precursor protein-binding family A member 2 isoform X2 [Latimeria chalumnae]|uniref:amyloid-beta A4 precursor protein-binding family A member 2 isoform X2 n=1 Tax=Latimeria chalumnae TaxID=7897 RepID=UPI00313C1C92
MEVEKGNPNSPLISHHGTLVQLEESEVKTVQHLQEDTYSLINSTLHLRPLDLKLATDTTQSCTDVCEDLSGDAEESDNRANHNSVENKLKEPNEMSSVTWSTLELDFRTESGVESCGDEVCQGSAEVVEKCAGPTEPECDADKKPARAAETSSQTSFAEPCLSATVSAGPPESVDEDYDGRLKDGARMEERDEKRDDDHSHIRALLAQLQTFNRAALPESERFPAFSHPERQRVSSCGETAEKLDDFGTGVRCAEDVQGLYGREHQQSSLVVSRSSCVDGVNGQAADFNSDLRDSDHSGILLAEDDRKHYVNLLDFEGLVLTEGCSEPLVAGNACCPSNEAATQDEANVGELERRSRGAQEATDLQSYCKALETMSPWSLEHREQLECDGCKDARSDAEEPEPGTSFRRTEPVSTSAGKEEDSSCASPLSPDGPPEPRWMKTPPCSKGDSVQSLTGVYEEKNSPLYPNFQEVPGPCEPEDLLDGVIFGAKYLGSTQLVSDKNPSTSVRMAQAQEAVDRIKAPEGESQPMTEVDLFISTQRIKVLTADTQEAMMDHSLQTISYIADIGNIVVLMARRKLPRKADEEATASSKEKKQYKMICHVFQSEDAQLIAQAIGQAFSVAYQQFLQATGINPSELRPSEYSDVLNNEELYNGDLAHFSKRENCKDICIRKQKGEILGLAIVESGWGSILPTVVVANLMHGGPIERSGELNIGDRIMSVNGTSLVGLPLTTCQNIFRICSLMRGGIAERGGIRVGHRIIEINGQSVVATAHEKIIHTLSHAVGEIHIKTMPACTYRLLTGQEQPVYL